MRAVVCFWFLDYWVRLHGGWSGRPTSLLEGIVGAVAGVLCVAGLISDWLEFLAAVERKR